MATWTMSGGTFLPAPEEEARRWQAEAQAAVIRDGQAAHGDFLVRVIARGIPALARPHDLDAVVAAAQPCSQAAQRHGDAIHFGRKGFGDECHAQQPACGDDGSGGGAVHVPHGGGALRRPYVGKIARRLNQYMMFNCFWS